MQFMFIEPAIRYFDTWSSFETVSCVILLLAALGAAAFLGLYCADVFRGRRRKIDGYNNREEKINGFGVYRIDPKSSIFVDGGEFSLASPVSINIWGGVFLSGAGIHNTEWESNGMNNEMSLACKAKVSLSLEPVQPNAPYREKTEVFTSYWLVNADSVNIRPEDNIRAVFEIIKPDGSVLMTRNVSGLVVPANDKNLVYFKWTVPEGLNGSNVIISASLTKNGIQVDRITKNYETVPHTVFSTPDSSTERPPNEWNICSEVLFPQLNRLIFPQSSAIILLISTPIIIVLWENNVIMERIEAFEKMLADIKRQAEFEQSEMEKLKAAGKEKTATYRQYFGNRMLYKMILDKYKQYGLLD